MTDDIVARLRDIEGGYGFRAICREAADEIERLRAERDGARRKICEMEAECIVYPPCNPQKYAVRMGWDCFKEETDGK